MYRKYDKHLWRIRTSMQYKQSFLGGCGDNNLSSVPLFSFEGFSFTNAIICLIHYSAAEVRWVRCHVIMYKPVVIALISPLLTVWKQLSTFLHKTHLKLGCTAGPLIIPFVKENAKKLRCSDFSQMSVHQFAQEWRWCSRNGSNASKMLQGMSRKPEGRGHILSAGMFKQEPDLAGSLNPFQTLLKHQRIQAKGQSFNKQR